jgi:hypothetical protein
MEHLLASRLPPLRFSSSKMWISDPAKPPSRIKKAAAERPAMPLPTTYAFAIVRVSPSGATIGALTAVMCEE